MTIKHDRDWLLTAFNSEKYDVDVGKRVDPLPFARDYREHMLKKDEQEAQKPAAGFEKFLDRFIADGYDWLNENPSEAIQEHIKASLFELGVLKKTYYEEKAKRVATPQQTTFNTVCAMAAREWAEVIWRESANGGVRVAIFSSYGDWSFYWSHPGSKSSKIFLASLEMEYMGGKMMGEKFRQSSPEETAKNRKRVILEMRRDCSLDKQEAVDEWHLTERLREGDIGIETFVLESKIEDTWDSICTEPDSDWKHFWDRLWVPHLQPALMEQP